MKSRKKWIILGLVLIIGYLILVKKLGVGIPCFFKKITGFYCPGCGITRMFISLLSFDFYQAFRYNQLVFIYLIGYLIFKVVSLKINIKVSNYFLYTLLVITIMFGVLRNIALFDYLRPTEIVRVSNK